MQTVNRVYNHLSIIQFSSLEFWDTKRYTSKLFTSNYNIVALETCIVEENKKYKLYEQKGKEFGILGVNNKEGIFDAYRQYGRDINQAYKKMEVGWLAYNPYRINVGSIGIKFIEHRNEYISPAYVVFSCKKNLLPEYLLILFKTSTFNKVINESTTGSVRQNLTFDILKSIKIPLPSIEEQTNIVKVYKSKISAAKQLQDEANSITSKMEEYFFEALSISNTENQTYKSLLNFIEFNNVVKWGVDYNLSLATGNLLKSLVYPNIKLGELVEINPITKLPKEDIDVSFIPMECISDEYGEVIDKKERGITESKGYTKFKEGDLIWARITPCMQNGKSAIVKGLKNSFGFGSTEFHVIRNTKGIVDLNYVYHILRLKKVLNSAQSHFTGSAGQQRVPKAFLEDLLIPVPPRELQVKISDKLNDLKTIKKNKELQAQDLIKEAEKTIENQIFK